MNIKNDLLRIIKIYFFPQKVFQEIKETDNITWLTPLLIILIIAILTSFLVVPVEIEQQIERTIEHQDLSEEEIENRLTYFNSFYHKLTTHFRYFIIEIIYFLIIAFILKIIVIKEKRIAFGKLFSAVVYIGIIKAVGLIIQRYIQSIQQTTDTYLHTGSLFTEIEGFLAYYLRTLNIFSLWQIILLAFTLTVFYGFSKLKSCIVMFSIWLVWNFLAAYFYYLRGIF